MHEALARLSLNQITTQRWSVREAAEGCVRSGIPWIALWRDKVAATGLEESARIVCDNGLRVSSLCRGGWFSASTAVERQKRFDDNRRAIEEAATLGTETLVLVCGPAADRDINAARAYVEETIACLLPYIELRRLRQAIDATGYAGPIEVEVLNQSIWDTSGDEVLKGMCSRYLEYVL